MGYCFKDKKNETIGTTHGNFFHFKNTELWFGSYHSHSLAIPHLQSVGNWQVKVLEEESLLWIWAKIQVSVVQPRLLDGERLLFCLQRCRGNAL